VKEGDIFFQDYLINRMFNLFEMEMFCSILSVFALTSKQFNAFLLNKSIILFFQNLNFWNVV